MDKGDIKTRRGKIFRGSYGIKRPRKHKKKQKYSVKKFELVIIESLKSDEKHTGKILHSEVIKYKNISGT